MCVSVAHLGSRSTAAHPNRQCSGPTDLSSNSMCIPKRLLVQVHDGQGFNTSKDIPLRSSDCLCLAADKKVSLSLDHWSNSLEQSL